MGELKSIFEHSKIYFPPIFIFALSLLIFSAFLSIPFYNYLFLIGFTIVIGISVLLLLGRQRKSQIFQIRNALNSIKENRIGIANEIKLSPELSEVEFEIRAMFLQTQKIIGNLKKLEQVRTEFLGNVSHELSTYFHKYCDLTFL
ncbi:MAG: hypothetical protein KJ799_05155 [Bacteroidetes bacterium]|nr:hypothetical protein [Bacteroidota bacterium]